MRDTFSGVIVGKGRKSPDLPQSEEDSENCLIADHMPRRRVFREELHHLSFQVEELIRSRREIEGLSCICEYIIVDDRPTLV